MSKTQTHQHHSTSLAAAFMAPPPVKKQQQVQVQGTPEENKFVRHNSSQSDCEDYYNQEQQAQQQQVQQQFTEQIQGPTFIPVFPSFKAILPHHNSSAKGQVPWSCSNCNNSKAFGHKCQHCHKSRDAAALRVFMGQLTKEGDVQLIIKMLEVLCPQLDQATSLLHIEPHTHANTGRGKGCAWVYVSSLDDVLYLVNRLHKRTYPTVNAQTGEVGFVAFPDSYSNEEVKSAFDNDITFLADHVVQLFHRSPITAEVPLSLQRALNLPANNNNNNNKNKNNNNNNNNNVSVHKPAGATDNNNNMKVVAYAAPSPSKAQVQQQQQQYEKNITPTSSPFKRYRWNPYAMSGAARVPTRG